MGIQQFHYRRLGLIFKLFIFFSCYGVHAQQSCLNLLQKAPLLPESVGKAFVSVKLEIKPEILDDGTEFKRVSAWSMTFDQKQYDEQLAKYVERWDKKAEENSFALNYIPDTTTETGLAMAYLKAIADSVVAIWTPVSTEARNLDPDFTVLSDMDFGCDEIKSSAQRLNKIAKRQNELLSSAKARMLGPFDRFQRYFNKLVQINDPLMNNEVIGQMSRMLSVLEDWNLIYSSTLSNMVETGISLNNGMCRPDHK